MRGIYQDCDERHLHRYLAELRNGIGIDFRSGRADKGRQFSAHSADAMMHDKSEIARLYATFEECRFEHDGAVAWRARDLMPRLGYARWENFREAIHRAWRSCETAGIDPTVNFLIGDGSQPWNPVGEVFREVTKNPQGGRQRGCDPHASRCVPRRHERRPIQT